MLLENFHSKFKSEITNIIKNYVQSFVIVSNKLAQDKPMIRSLHIIKANKINNKYSQKSESGIYLKFKKDC